MQIEVGDARELLGKRVQRYLRWRFGRDAAKEAAAITGADLRTARGWVESAREPKGEALLAIISDMGREGLLALFSPEVETHEQSMARQIDVLKDEVARLEAQLGKSRTPATDQMAEGPARPAPAQRINQNRVWRGPAGLGTNHE